jgi:hypothetical protein
MQIELLHLTHVKTSSQLMLMTIGVCIPEADQHASWTRVRDKICLALCALASLTLQVVSIQYLHLHFTLIIH